MSIESEANGSPWERLAALARRLRGPEGCPWDRQQTLRTLAPFLVEEAFEVLHAAEQGDPEQIGEEIGDLAFVLALSLAAAEDEELARFPEVARRTDGKIRRRHPHVFGSATALTPREAARQWEIQKHRERSATDLPEDGDTRAPGDIPGSLAPPSPELPALIQARKLQEKAAQVGFDWKAPAPVVEKIREELAELEGAIEAGGPGDIREELGDLLFTAVNLCRLLRVDPEGALRAGNRKFRDRFNRMISRLDREGLEPGQVPLEQLDHHWEAVKVEDRDPPGS